MPKAFVLFAVAVLAALPASAEDCPPRDFLALPLPSGDPVEVAIETAFPGTDLAGERLRLPDGTVLTVAPAQDAPPATRLARATFGDQFAQIYPLAWDPAPRRTPWFDPGRAREAQLFAALWGATEGAVRADLVTVPYAGAGVTARFQVTSRHCAASQLALALAEIAALGPQMDSYFTAAGGGFNWRTIAGTDRLSAHSWGIAVDVNAELGGYWRWAGAPEGAAGDWDFTLPEALVRAMERRGWIWGGKWHHYDGMHFEYRPELILYARLTAR